MKIFFAKPLVSALVALPGSRPGASGYATLVGRVTDQSGAVVPNAAITIVNQETGLTRTVNTESSGDYIASALPASLYPVSAEITGFSFKEAVLADILLQAAQTPRVDIMLSVGDATQRVEVTAE